MSAVMASNATTPFGPFENPWTMLEAARELPMEDRQPHLQTWMLLVVQKKPSEQDALLSAGRDTWGYQAETARRALKEMEKVAKGTGRPAIALVTDAYLAEAVYRPGADTPYGYLKYSIGEAEQEPEFVEQIEDGKTIFRPPASALIEGGTILLPTGIEEYGATAALFAEVRDYIAGLVYSPNPHIATLAAAYALMTWVHDRFPAVPYLRVLGDYGTGKTRRLQAIGSVCYRPIMAAGATTPSPLFRITEQFRGTLILDEADFDVRSEYWGEIIKLLNLGYNKGFQVLRAEKGPYDGFDVRGYDCFGPKVLATRREFPDPALESRCLSFDVEVIRDRDLPASVPLAFTDEARAAATRLRNKLLLWRFRTLPRLDFDSRRRLPGIELRSQQMAQPLLAWVDDPGLREMLTRSLADLGDSVAAQRQETLEGRVLAALAQHLPTILRGGRTGWRVTEATQWVNAGRPAREWVSEKVIGRRLRAFGFRRFSVEGNVAAYEYDVARLRQHLDAYRIGEAGTPARSPMTSLDLPS